MTINDIPANVLKEYFGGKRKTPVYEQCVKMYRDLRVHAFGEFPDHLITKRRPNEPDNVFTYRKDNFEPVTKVTWNSVIQSLGKIRRSPDWAVKYNKDASFPKVKQAELLQVYCEVDFPYYKSVTNWMFSVGLQAITVDANCAIMVIPLNSDWKDTEYPRPYPIIFHSDQIIEFLEGEFAILKSNEPNPNNPSKTCDKYYVVTTKEIVPYVKVKDTWTAVEDEIIIHNLDYLPVIRPRAQLVKTVRQYNIFESRLNAMLPHLNDAIRGYSDLQASSVCHLFPERWEYVTQECTTCNGSGKIDSITGTGKDRKTKQIVCTTCKGAMYVSNSSPFDKTLVRLAKAGMETGQAPTPPMGYVVKDIDTIKVMDAMVEKQHYKALSAINMQFLTQTPLSISGDAKAVDRDELNNFAYNIAEDLIYVMDYIYQIITDYRYMVTYPQSDERYKMLPEIPVPQNFDLMGAEAILKSLTAMRGSNLSGSTVTAMECEYIQKQFADKPEQRDQLILEKSLDPFAGVLPADKLAAFQSGQMAPRDYIRSCYIQEFIQQAIAEDPTFKTLDRAKQIEILKDYADDVLEEIKGSKVLGRQPKITIGADGISKQVIDAEGNIFDMSPAQSAD